MAASAKFLKEATDFDSENKPFEAFVKYLEATASLCLDIAEKCKLGMENAFSDYAKQRIKLISHCYERAASVQERICPTQSSSAAEETHAAVRQRNDSCNLPTNPEELAKEINRQLILRHRESVKMKHYTESELASKEIALQKKMLENLSLAEQKKRKSLQPPTSPPASRRTLGRNISSVKNEFSAGFQNTLRRGNQSSESNSNTLGRRSMGNEPRVNYIPTNIEIDSDMEAGPALPKLDVLFDPDLVSALEPKEKTRQITVLELIHTEKTHVGHLKILSKVYYQPLKQHSILPENFVEFAPCTLFTLIFSNFDEILDIHIQMNQTLKSLLHSKTPIHYIGDVLLKFFDRENGEKFKSAVVQFCQYQQYAIEQIEERKNQDIKFDYFLTDAQNHRLSRNFTLADWLLKEMQRLTKYPLLIEQIIKHTDESEREEIQKLKRCLQCTKALLEATNAAKRNFDSWRKLTELQQDLDTSKFDRVNHPVVLAFQKFDLRHYTFIHDGFLTWKQGHHKVANVHGVLVDEALILLTKKSNKLLLKFHGASITTDERDGSTKVLRYCPIVVLTAVEVKDDPTEEGRFFIYERNSTVPPYELTARSNGEKSLWLKYLQEQINNKKSKPNVVHEPHSLVEQMDVVKPDKDTKLNDSGVSDDLHEGNIELKAKLTRKINRFDGIIFNTLLNKEKYLAEILNLSLDDLNTLATVINVQVENHQVKDLTTGAILQVDAIIDMITKATSAENLEESCSAFGSVPCIELSPVTHLLSKYLNLILVAVT